MDNPPEAHVCPCGRDARAPGCSHCRANASSVRRGGSPTGGSRSATAWEDQDLRSPSPVCANQIRNRVGGPEMKRSSSLRRLRIAAALALALAFLAAAVTGLQRASVAQSEATTSPDAPVSFPVDI